MKKYIITILLLLLSFTYINAININTYSTYTQKDTTILKDNTFQVISTKTSENIKTKYSFTDKDGKIYPIYISPSNKVFIFKISKKTNKCYRYYLNEEISNKVLSEYMK